MLRKKDFAGKPVNNNMKGKQPPRPFFKKKWFRSAALVAILLPIGIFIYNTDFRMVLRELSGVGFRFTYILATTVAAYLLGTIAWWVCLGTERSKISLPRLFLIRQVAETVGLYNPTSVVGGDLLKNELLKPHGIEKNISSASIVVSRVTAILSQLTLVAVAAAWLCYYTWDHTPLAVRLGVGVLVILAVGFHIVFLQKLKKTGHAEAREPEVPVSFINKTRDQIGTLIKQTQTFFIYRKREFWMSYLFFALHWIVGSIEFYLILVFLGFDISLMHGILLDMGVILFKSIGAFIPGQIGVEEIGNKLVLMAIGIQAASTWLTVSILRRCRQLFWIIVGMISFIFLRKTETLKLFSYGSSVR